MKKIFTFITAVLFSTMAMAQTYTYTADLSQLEAGMSIVGDGSFVEDNTFGTGKVFQNGGGAQRSHYLLLESDQILAQSAESKALSIGFWINAKNAGASADYMWAPMFMAYENAPVNNENTWPMLGCQYRGVLQVNCGGWCDYTDVQNAAGVNTLYHGDLDWLADKQWHYYTVVFENEIAKVYFDGILKNQWDASIGGETTQVGLLSYGGLLKRICIGGNQAWSWGDNDAAFQFAKFRVQNNAMTAEDIAAQMANDIIVEGDYEYSAALSKLEEGMSIVGSGSFVSDDTFGTVFQNVATAVRSSYLLLPEDLLAHSQTSKALSIGFWVNAGEAESGTYDWAPIFTAYAQQNNPNSWPMFVCQYRGVLQTNCAGWTDYADAQNVSGVNAIYNGEKDWLADKKWHYYTVVLHNDNAKVYFDGVVANEWNLDGSDGQYQRGLFSNGGELKYICLGGNQAWDWSDFDAPFKFAQLVVKNSAMTQEEIQAIVNALPTGIENVKMNNNSNGVRYNIAGQQVTADYKGLVIENGRKVLKK